MRTYVPSKASLVAGALLVLLAACNTGQSNSANNSQSEGTTSATSASTPQPTASSTPQANNNKAGDTKNVTKIKVTETEMAIQPAVATAPAGPVEFDVTNAGKHPHEFVVFKTDLPLDKLPTKGREMDEEGKGVEHIAEIGEEQLQSGKTATLQTNLKPGKYVLVCNLPGHFAAGMKVAFTVTEKT